jgi:hypothetical protein
MPAQREKELDMTDYREAEFPALIAILVYTLIAWILRFIWLLFSRTG